MLKWLYIPLILLLWSFGPQQVNACEQHQTAAANSCELPEKEAPSHHICCDSENEHPADQESHHCSQHGACCCVVPLAQSCCLIAFAYDFSEVNQTIQQEYSILHSAVVTAGFSSIFIPPKIA